MVTGVRIPRIYECSNGNCGLQFKRKLVSLVTPCPRCRTISYDRDFDPQKHNLDWYSAKKELWYKYPELHIEHIKSRNLEGKDKRYVVRDKKGRIVEREEQIPV
jgi:hypothetical protein